MLFGIGWEWDVPISLVDADKEETEGLDWKTAARSQDRHRSVTPTHVIYPKEWEETKMHKTEENPAPNKWLLIYLFQ